MKALEETGGKKQKAAETLGRTRQWLDKHIKDLGLEEQVKGLRVES